MPPTFQLSKLKSPSFQMYFMYRAYQCQILIRWLNLRALLLCLTTMMFLPMNEMKKQPTPDIIWYQFNILGLRYSFKTEKKNPNCFTFLKLLKIVSRNFLFTKGALCRLKTFSFYLPPPPHFFTDHKER